MISLKTKRTFISKSCALLCTTMVCTTLVLGLGLSMDCLANADTFYQTLRVENMDERSLEFDDIRKGDKVVLRLVNTSHKALLFQPDNQDESNVPIYVPPLSESVVRLEYDNMFSNKLKYQVSPSPYHILPFGIASVR